ncbi:MAG: hypothetical protein KDD53_12675, partial [Bdellovibrionales bacterium]|nr:hypothetical protein [Bdellovibrionales bacterium]
MSRRILKGLGIALLSILVCQSYALTQEQLLLVEKPNSAWACSLVSKSDLSGKLLKRKKSGELIEKDVDKFLSKAKKRISQLSSLIASGKFNNATSSIFTLPTKKWKKQKKKWKVNRSFFKKCKNKSLFEDIPTDDDDS